MIAMGSTASSMPTINFQTQSSVSPVKHDNQESISLSGWPAVDREEAPVRWGTRRVLRQYADSGIRFESPSPVEFIDVPPVYTRS